jgi:hypothetical protein
MNSKITIYILIGIIFLTIPAVGEFSRRHFNSQSKNIEYSRQWIVNNLSKINSIYHRFPDLQIEVYTGNNGCVMVKYDRIPSGKNSSLGELLKIECKVPLYVTGDLNEKHRIYKAGDSIAAQQGDAPEPASPAR